jgi:photosystem II stability/assembly factor-like uncharacterized protein
MKNYRLPFIYPLFLVFTCAYVKAQSIVPLQQGKPTSIRGLSVVDDNVAWVSGSRGNVAITSDGGKTWNWQQVKGYEKSDFRDVEAFSAKEAVIMSSGTPALILKTIDGGTTWQEKYRNTDTTYFLDAMDFNNPKHGIVLGDPIKNKFLLLETNDGAETWHPFKNELDAMPGEAAFAASGTCLRVDQKAIIIVSGGKVAANSQKWHYAQLPLAQGKSSEGAFSSAKEKNNLIIVGGDYAKDKRRDSTACYSTDNGLTWKLIENSPLAFQSSIEYFTYDIVVSTGTSGSNISADGGKTWKRIDDISYNVCRKAKKGKLILLAGDRGKIGILKM